MIDGPPCRGAPSVAQPAPDYAYPPEIGYSYLRLTRPAAHRMPMDTTAPATRQASGYVLAFIATIFWSSTAIFIRHLTEQELPPLVLAFWRDLLVALAMVAALAIVQPKLLRVPGRHMPFFVLYGFVLMAFNGTWTVSVDLNGAAVSTVLAYSSP